MNADNWYALRGAATRYRLDKERHRAQLSGAIRRVRSAGYSWQAIGKAAGMSASTVTRLAA